MGPTYIRVTTLTFWGHVTSSITWPSDSAWPLSYWWSMMTMVNDDHASVLHGYGVTELQRLWGHEFDFLGSRDRSHDHWTRHTWFSIGGLLEPNFYLPPLRRYKASNLHLPMLKARSSLRMLRVTWPVGRGSKMTTYLEFPRPYCLFTIQLLCAYDDD